MGFADAVHWWEEWQLRVLVLSSLFLQYFLMVAAAMRKHPIPSWFRFLTWLAYLGSDAIAIYALAALFNRHWKKEGVSTHADNGSLEALWAPILLVHLGGQDGITAYNIEDNELWRRHVLTAVSQIAVAIYVFHKSWSGDKKLLQAAICIFATGILKCFEKPLALKSASINSLMNSHAPSSDRDLEGEGPARDALYNLFVDIVPSDSTQLCRILNLTAHGDVHDKLQSGLSESFDRLYTKEQVFSLGRIVEQGFGNYFLAFSWKRRCGYLLRTLVFYLTFLAIGFFRKSHREGYNNVDVKITYALLWGTAVLETIMGGLLHAITSVVIGSPWPEQVAQYNIMGYLVRNRKHRMLRKIAALVFCKEYLDQLWCMKPCKSSRGITNLVHGYIQKWMQHHVRDQAMIFRGFNNNRGHWTLKEEGCGGSTIEAILRRPFDESVLLWHLTTDFCFHHMDTSPSHSVAFRCRVISNYMAYLLFMNPEMLITGARRSLFRATYKKLRDFALDETEPTYKGLDEKELTKMIIQKVKGMEGEGIVHGAWALAGEIMDSCREDEEKMWRVIQGVWVEMLGFSAARCRGYLNAKSLGKGGEYLSYVWLLLSCMGIETLAEKMQSTELVRSSIQQGNYLVQNICYPGTVPRML